MNASSSKPLPIAARVAGRRPFFRAFVRALSRLRRAEPVPDAARA